MPKIKIRGPPKYLSNKIKVEIIKKIDEGVKKSVIARETGIPLSTIQTIYSKKSKYSNISLLLDRKSLNTCKNKQLEELVLTFVNETKSANLPLSGKLIREKAKEIAETLSLDDFTASNGWLWRFKRRNGLFLDQKNDGQSADNEKIEDARAENDSEAKIVMVTTSPDILPVDLSYRPPRGEEDDDEDSIGIVEEDADQSDDSASLETPTDSEVNNALQTIFDKLNNSFEDVPEDVWDGFKKVMKYIDNK